MTGSTRWVLGALEVPNADFEQISLEDIELMPASIE